MTPRTRLRAQGGKHRVRDRVTLGMAIPRGKLSDAHFVGSRTGHPKVGRCLSAKVRGAYFESRVKANGTACAWSASGEEQTVRVAKLPRAGEPIPRYVVGMWETLSHPHPGSRNEHRRTS